ncbi:MAG: cytoskeletal protein CcmA (bactofilin family) [Patescibacteria group bacterium]|jgi:cytoskeletal protein CcmA (bactofilin family)
MKKTILTLVILAGIILAATNTSALVWRTNGLDMMNLSDSGNLTLLIGNVTAPFYYGSGKYLTNITADVIANNTRIAHNVTIGEWLTVDGNLNVTGTSYLGDTTITSDNITTNNIIPKDGGNVTIDGNLTLSDKITFALGGVIDNLVAGWITITGNLQVDGDVNVTGSLNVSENITASSVTVHGNLNVTGTSYLGDTTITSDNITTNNIIPKDGENVTIDGNLTLSEKITFSLGEIIDNIVDGWIRITGSLQVDGDVNVTGSLNVSENITTEYYFGDGSQLTGMETVFSITNSTTISTTSTTDALTGMTLTPGAGNYSVLFNSQYEIEAGNITQLGAPDLTILYNELMAVPATITNHSVTFGSETLTPGVYTVTGASNIIGTLTLDAQNDPNAIFIFRFGAALSSTAGATITLINGSSASNIFFIADAAMPFGAGTTLKGTFISNNGAPTLGAGCNLEGRLMARNGITSTDSSTVQASPISSSFNSGVLQSFAIFNSVGNLVNTGVSIITGDVGTNSGTITGFTTGMVSGNIYLPGSVSDALVTFSIYQNGVLINNSIRERTFQVNTVDVTLQSIATVTEGQTIDVRYKIDTGEVVLENRILTLIKN